MTVSIVSGTMRNSESLQKNFIMNAILTVATVIFPLITFPYAARVLQPEGMGKVSFAYSVISYFVVFAQLGIPTYGVYMCAKMRDDREVLSQLVRELLKINLITCGAAYTVLFGAVALVPRMRAEKELYLSLSVLIMFEVLGMEWLYKALEKYAYITIRSIVLKAIAIVAMFAVVKTEQDYVVYGVISIFAACASGICNLCCAKKYITWKPTKKYRHGHHLKRLGAFFGMACATTISTHLDTVMLGLMSTDASVGYYNTAVKIKVILVNVVTSLGAVLLPRASYCVEHGLMDEFRANCRRAVNFVLLLAPALMVYFMLYAEQAVLLLSGAAYSRSVLPMQIIMPTVLLVGMTSIMGVQILIPLGKEKIMLRATMVGVVTNMILNALLIPKYAEVGAAVGTLLAELMVLVVQYRAIKGQVEGIFRKMQYGKILLALLVGVIASGWVAYLPMYNWVILAISACLFFGAYCVVLLCVKETLSWEIIRQVARLLPFGGKKIDENIANQQSL